MPLVRSSNYILLLVIHHIDRFATYENMNMFAVRFNISYCHSCPSRSPFSIVYLNVFIRDSFTEICMMCMTKSSFFRFPLFSEAKNLCKNLNIFKSDESEYKKKIRFAVKEIELNDIALDFDFISLITILCLWIISIQTIYLNLFRSFYRIITILSKLPSLLLQSNK